MPKHKHKGDILTDKNFSPRKIKGREIKGLPTKADFDYFLNPNNLKNKEGGKELLPQFQKPLQVNYIGYDGFIGDKDKDKKNEEGKETFGITIFEEEGKEMNMGRSYTDGDSYSS